MTLPEFNECREVYTLTACSEALGILDSGCQRTVMGIFPFLKWEAKLRDMSVVKHDLPRLETDEIFKFGNNGRLKALFRVEIPVGIFGQTAILDVCIVAGQTPLLISRETTVKLGLAIDFGRQTVTSETLEVSSMPLIEHGGHLILDMMSFPKTERAYKAEVFHDLGRHEIGSDSLGEHAAPDTHPPVQTYTAGEDQWCWVTPDVCCRQHLCRRSSPFRTDTIDGASAAEFSPCCIQLRHYAELGTQVEVLRYALEQPTQVDMDAWIGETWFWKRGLGTRELLGVILSRSQFPVKPRSLRLAWSHGNRAVPQVLVDDEQPSLPAREQDPGDSPEQGGIDRGNPSTAGQSSQARHVEAHVRGGVANPLEDDAQLHASPLQSNDPTEWGPQERGEEPLPGAWDSGGRDYADRRHDVGAENALGEAVCFASGHERPARQEGQCAEELGRSGLGDNRAQHGDTGRRVGAAANSRGRGGGTASTESGSHLATSAALAAKLHEGTISAGDQDQGKDARLGDDDLFRDLFQRHRKTMNKAERAFVADRLSQHAILMTAAQTWEKGLGRKLRVLEVLAGSMSLSRNAHGWEVLQPCDLELGDDGVDLTTVEGQRLVRDQIQRQDPDLICWAPPCSDYSPLQSIWPRDPTKRAKRLLRLIQKRKQSSKLWRFCLSCIRQDETNPRPVRPRIHLVENPWTSRLGVCSTFPGVGVRVDQCRFGLKVSETSSLKVMKPTRLQCTDPQVAALLERHCACEPRKHDHIISGDKVHGQWFREQSDVGHGQRLSADTS